MFPPPRNADSPATTEYPWTGPSALVFQVGQFIICDSRLQLRRHIQPTPNLYY